MLNTQFKDDPLHKEAMNTAKCYIFTCIISADNDEFNLSEDDKQEIIHRHDVGCSWDYVLEPIRDEKQRKTLIDFFEE